MPHLQVLTTSQRLRVLIPLLLAATAACASTDGSSPTDLTSPLPPDTPEPFSVTVLSGSSQTVLLGEILPNELRVRVTSDAGRPIRDVQLRTNFTSCGVLVTCSSQPDTATLARIVGDSALTGTDGVATFRVLAPRQLGPVFTPVTEGSIVDLRVYAFGRTMTAGSVGRTLRGSAPVPTVLVVR